jgi:CBS domain-containing protein
MYDRSVFLATSRRLDLATDSTSVVGTLGELVSAHAIVVAEDISLAELCDLLVEHRVPAIAVADRTGALRGLVTRTDVLRASDPRARAADAMSRFVFALPATSSVARAAALMAYEGVGQLVVTGAGGGLLGMVSAIDIVRYYAATVTTAGPAGPARAELDRARGDAPHR